MKKYIKPEAKVLRLSITSLFLEGSGENIPTGQSDEFNTGIGEDLDEPSWLK